MSRNAHLAVAFVVAAALAATPLLLPSAADLGSHLLSDRQAPLAQPYLELALAQGGPEREVVVPLARVYSQQGEHAAALRLLQTLQANAASPAIADMRRAALLGSGRTWEYVRELEQIRGVHATAAVLRELADRYAEQRLVELQVDALEQLLSMEPDNSALCREVAWLSVDTGDKTRALALLRRLWSEQPASFLPNDFGLLARLTIELDPSDAALALIVEHGADFGGDAEQVALARHFHSAGRPRDARRLLDPMVEVARPDATVLTAWARTLVALGQTEEAYGKLRAWARQGRSTDPINSLLCELALEEGDAPTALKIAAAAEFRGMGDRLLLWLGRAAADGGDLATLGLILDRVDDAAMASDPVAATHMTLVAGQRQRAARWAARAEGAENLSAGQQIWLAELLLQMNLKRRAAAVLQAATVAAPEVAQEPLRLALLWWRTGAYAEGLRFFDAERARRSPSLRASRALLLAASGRVEPALTLLKGQALPAHSALTRHWLQALLNVAGERRQPALAVFGYRHMLAARPGRRSLQLALAQSELAAGTPLAALVTLRQLPRPLHDSEVAAWREVLLAAHRHKAAVAEELTEAAAAHLDTLDLGSAEAQSWVHLLLELDAIRPALPFVERLAELKGGHWQGRLIELNKLLGDTQRVLALWRARGLDEKEAPAQRLHAANQLLRAKDRQTALRIYQSVAAPEGSNGATVKQLLHLWGPRPGPQAVEWVAARARLAQGQARVNWLRHLLSIGGDAAALSLIGDDPPAGPLLALWVDIRMSRREHGALAGLVLARVSGLQQADMVRRLASLCAAHGHHEAAEKAYGRLLALTPSDAAGLLYLARRSASRPQQATRHWRAWFALPESKRGAASWQDHVALGNLLMGHGATREAGQAHLRQALKRLGAPSVSTTTRLRESGRLLARLERPAEAAPLLAQALAGQPCDDALRADLVAALMATRDFDKARAAVDPPARCRQPEGARPGGQK